MLAIVGGKGGCGKTTTALGLARGLAAAGERPIVVDADCDMPNLHTVADVDPSPGLGALADGAPIDRLVHRSAVCPDVDVVPAGGASSPLAPATLDRLKHTHGRVLVDCPAGATDAVAGPLRAADSAVVVSTPDRPSRVDAAKSARMAEALSTHLAGAVLTQVPDDRPAPREAPLRAVCDVLVEVPEVAETGGSVLTHPVCRTAYERLAARLRERNI